MTSSIVDRELTRYRVGNAIMAYIVYFCLLLPIFIVVPMSFGSTGNFSFPPDRYSLDLFTAFFTSVSWTQSLWLSVKIGVMSTVISMSVGVPVAYWTARHDFFGKRLISMLLLSPLIIPHVIAGLGLFLYFSYARFSGTVASIVLGHVMTTMPFVIVVTLAGIRKLDRNLEFGAELMGASPARVFITVVAPQLIPSMIGAALFAFLLSFDEVVISWFLSGPDAVTLPVKMYSALSFEVSPVIAAVATFLMAISFVTTLVALRFRATPSGEM